MPELETIPGVVPHVLHLCTGGVTIRSYSNNDFIVGAVSGIVDFIYHRISLHFIAAKISGVCRFHGHILSCTPVWPLSLPNLC